MIDNTVETFKIGVFRKQQVHIHEMEDAISQRPKLKVTSFDDTEDVEQSPNVTSTPSAKKPNLR